MKNEDQHIDTLFQALKADTFKAPPSFLDDLKLRMDAKVARKKKFIFWYSIFGFVLVTAIGGVFFTQNSKNKSSEAIAHTSPNQIENNDSITSKAFNSAQQKAPKQTINKEETNISKTVDSAKKSSDQQEKTLNSKIRNQDSSSKTSTKINGKRTFKKNSSQNSKMDPASSQVSSITNSDITKSNSKLPTDKSLKTADNKDNVKLGNQDKSKNSKNSDSFEKSKTTNNQLSVEDNGQIDSKNESQTISEMKLKPPTFENGQHNLLNNKNLLPTNPELFEKRISQNWEFDAQLYGGAMLTSSKFNPVFDGTNSTDFIYKSSISPTFGARTNVFYKNINASVGVEYFKTGDKIEYSTNTIAQVGADSVFLYTQTDTIWVDTTFTLIDYDVYDVTPIFDTILEKNKIKNSYSWISIPVSFGYRFNVGSWAVIPAVGINLNFGVASNSGEYPTGIDAKAKYDAVKFNTDIRIQTEVRKVFGNYYVFATPYFRKNLQPIISYPGLTTTQNNWGLNVGAGIKF